MLNTILEYKKLILAVCLSLLLLLGVGYFFAGQKSEPVYVSKIDKLMFDTNNKAPKYVITLPEKKEKASDEQKIVDTPSLQSDKSSGLPKIDSVEDLLANVPNILTLKSQKQTQQLRYLNTEDYLSETKGSLVLPKIGTNGRKPWDAYGKRVRVIPTFKKVSVLFKGLGLNREELDKLNTGLRSEVSFSFSPYMVQKKEGILSSRQNGHETYVDLLLPSKDVLKSDNGPMALNLTISQEGALNLFEQLLNTGAPIGGIVINDGIADDSNLELLKNIISEAGKRGLLIVDATQGMVINNIERSGIAFAKADFVIENIYDREKINDIINKAENLAMDKGNVLIVAEAKPVVVIELLKWMDSFSPQLDYEQMKNTTIDKPLAVVPVSNLVVEQ